MQPEVDNTQGILLRKSVQEEVAMALRWVAAVASLAGVCLVARSARWRGRRTDHLEEGLELCDPKDAFRSDGGSMEVWNSNVRVLQEASMSVDRMTLEPRGLALFKYSDVGRLCFILEGKAQVSLSFEYGGFGHERTVEKGEIITVPPGVGHWWYNVGENICVVLGVANTREIQVNPSEDNIFHRNGGSAEDWGSVIFHGFDEELLSQAWDLDPDVVRQIRNSQKGTVIVKVPENITIPCDERYREYVSPTYTYQMDNGFGPHQRIGGAGKFMLVDKTKVGMLKYVQESALRVILNPGSLLAPIYVSNAYLLIYITRGSGHIQVIGKNEHLLRFPDLKEGSVVVVPKSHPYITKAGNKGLEFLAVATSDSPKLIFLAGRNAVFRSIPVEVLAAGNNVPIEVQKKIFDHRQNEAFIFPPRWNLGGSM